MNIKIKDLFRLSGKLDYKGLVLLILSNTHGFILEYFNKNIF